MARANLVASTLHTTASLNSYEHHRSTDNSSVFSVWRKINRRRPRCEVMPGHSNVRVVGRAASRSYMPEY